MSNDVKDDLAASVRERIRSGRLPADRPTRVWAGYGPGSDRCRICGALVPAGQVVMEAVFGTEDDDSVFFHRDCFSAAEAEWTHLERAPPAPAARVRTDLGEAPE